MIFCKWERGTCERGQNGQKKREISFWEIWELIGCIGAIRLMSDFWYISCTLIFLINSLRLTLPMNISHCFRNISCTLICLLNSLRLTLPMNIGHRLRPNNINLGIFMWLLILFLFWLYFVCAITLHTQFFSRFPHDP